MTQSPDQMMASLEILDRIATEAEDRARRAEEIMWAATAEARDARATADGVSRLIERLRDGALDGSGRGGPT